jgi:hypothetical protein
MQNMSDEELDKIFKEAAEGVEIPNDPTAWQGMSARLDEHRDRPGIVWNKSLLVAALAITGIAVVSVLTLRQAVEMQPTDNSETIISKQAPVQDRLLREQTYDVQKETSLQGNTTQTNTKPGNSTYPSVGNDDTYTKHFQNVSNQTLKGTQPQKDEPAITKINEGNSQSSISALQAISESNSSSFQDSSVTEEAIIASLPDSLNAEKESNELKEKKAPMATALNLKLVLSPDFSSIEFFTPDKRPGWNYGFLMGYSINSRWSVYSGLIVSRKIYYSTKIKEQYSTGYNDYPVKRLEGDCKVLDIPVNVYYRVFMRNSLSFTVGAGFSSYIMKSEDYVYELDKSYGDNTYTQSIRDKNQEWFKVLNLSVMVEKQVGKRTFLEFEPFVKAPLAGVGEGEVSLVSLGAFLNLRYALFVKK